MKKVLTIITLLFSLLTYSQTHFNSKFEYKYIQIELNIIPDTISNTQESYFVELSDNNKLIREYKDNNNYILPLEYNKLYKLTVYTNKKKISTFIFTDDCPTKEYLIPLYYNFNEKDTNDIYTLCYTEKYKQFKVYKLNSNK